MLEAAAWGIDREALAEAIDREALAEAIDPEDLVEARQVVEAGVHLGVGPEDSTDQAHAPTAAEVPPAWALEEAASVVAAAVAVEGGGRHGRQT